MAADPDKVQALLEARVKPLKDPVARAIWKKFPWRTDKSTRKGTHDLFIASATAASKLGIKKYGTITLETATPEQIQALAVMAKIQTEDLDEADVSYTYDSKARTVTLQGKAPRKNLLARAAKLAAKQYNGTATTMQGTGREPRTITVTLPSDKDFIGFTVKIGALGFVTEATDEAMMLRDWPSITVRIFLTTPDTGRNLEAPMFKALKTLPYVSKASMGTVHGNKFFLVTIDGTKLKPGWETNPHNVLLIKLHTDLRKKGVDLTHPKDAQGRGGMGSMPTRQRAMGEALDEALAYGVLDAKKVKYYRDLGETAFKSGVKPYPLTDPAMQVEMRKHGGLIGAPDSSTSEMMQAWGEGWHRANATEATTSGSVGGFSIGILGQAAPLPPKKRKKKPPTPATFVVGGTP